MFINVIWRGSEVCISCMSIYISITNLKYHTVAHYKVVLPLANIYKPNHVLKLELRLYQVWAKPSLTAWAQLAYPGLSHGFWAKLDQNITTHEWGEYRMYCSEGSVCTVGLSHSWQDFWGWQKTVINRFTNCPDWTVTKVYKRQNYPSHTTFFYTKHFTFEIKYPLPWQSYMGCTGTAKIG